jgi:hypothetical protein
MCVCVWGGCLQARGGVNFMGQGVASRLLQQVKQCVVSRVSGGGPGTGLGGGGFQAAGGSCSCRLLQQVKVASEWAHRGDQGRWGGHAGWNQECGSQGG